MRVAITGLRGFPNVQGGVEKQCQELAVRLVKLGCEVIVFTRRPYVNPEIKEYRGVKLVALPAIRHKILEAAVHTLLSVVCALRYRPTVLHIQSIGPALFTPLARVLGMKVVVTSQGSNYRHPKWGFISGLILRWAEFLGIVFADQVIAVSQSIAEEIEQKYNRKVTVIPNGINISQISNCQNSLKKYALAKGRYFLSVGRLVPVKGFEKIIDAFSQLKPNGWKLVIVGAADHRSQYAQRLKQQAALNPNIVLTGAIYGEALRELFSHAGLFILASSYEGLPIALMEAMSYGLLCLVSDIAANRSLGLPEHNYFNPANGKEFSKKLQQFSQCKLSAAQKSQQIKMLQQRYNWDQIARSTFEVYQNLR